MTEIVINENFHCSMRPIQRSKGRSEVAAAAYIGALQLEERREGKWRTCDFTRRNGVIRAQTYAPVEAPAAWCDPQALLDDLGKSAPRRDAVAMREVVVALPIELSDVDRFFLGQDFAQWLVETYQVAVYAAWHEPSRQGDQRNFHMHLLVTAKRVEPGKPHGFGRKVVALDPIAARRAQPRVEPAVQAIRQKWAELANLYLAEVGEAARFECRSLKERAEEAYRGNDLASFARLARRPSVHEGTKVRAMELKNQEVLSKSREIGDFERGPIWARVVHYPLIDRGTRRVFNTYLRESSKVRNVGALRRDPAHLPIRDDWLDYLMYCLEEIGVLSGIGIVGVRQLAHYDGAPLLHIGTPDGMIWMAEDQLVFISQQPQFSPDFVLLGRALTRVARWAGYRGEGDKDFVGAMKACWRLNEGKYVEQLKRPILPSENLDLGAKGEGAADARDWGTVQVGA